jgi:hypothetical protein
VVLPAPRPSKGAVFCAVDLLERVAVPLSHDRRKPLDDEPPSATRSLPLPDSPSAVVLQSSPKSKGWPPGRWTCCSASPLASDQSARRQGTVRDETPPTAGLPVGGHLQVCIPALSPLYHGKKDGLFGSGWRVHALYTSVRCSSVCGLASCAPSSNSTCS